MVDFGLLIIVRNSLNIQAVAVGLQKASEDCSILQMGLRSQFMLFTVKLNVKNQCKPVLQLFRTQNERIGTRNGAEQPCGVPPQVELYIASLPFFISSHSSLFPSTSGTR